MIRYFVLAYIGLAFAHPVRADSDGYYCNGSGYVAYEFSLSKPSYIFVVSLGSQEGISSPKALKIDGFHSNLFECQKGELIVHLSQSRVSINVSQPRNPSITRTSKEISAPVLPRLRNLGAYAVPGSVELESDDRAHRYFLTSTDKEERHIKDGEGGIIYHYIETRIIQKDRNGKILHELLVFRGVREETVD